MTFMPPFMAPFISFMYPFMHRFMYPLMYLFIHFSCISCIPYLRLSSIAFLSLSPAFTHLFPSDGACFFGTASLSLLPHKCSYCLIWNAQYTERFYSICKYSARNTISLICLFKEMGVNPDLIFGPRDGTGWACASPNGKFAFDVELCDGVPMEALLHSKSLERRGIEFQALPIHEAVRLIAAAGGRSVLKLSLLLHFVAETICSSLSHLAISSYAAISYAAPCFIGCSSLSCSLRIRIVSEILTWIQVLAHPPTLGSKWYFYCY